MELRKLNEYVQKHQKEVFKRIAIENKITLTKQGIEQLEQDFKRVETDWGRSVIAAEIDKLNELLKELENK